LSIGRIVGPGLWVVAFIGFAAAFWSAMDWRFSARLMPQTAAAAGLGVIAAAGIMMALAKRQGTPIVMARTSHDAAGPFKDLSDGTVYGRLGIEALWLVGLLAAVAAIGLLPALGLYVFSYMVTAGRTRWTLALAITASLWVGFYLLFVKLLHVPWPPSLLGDAFPDLREMTGRLI
jgi:hypothetical protein